MAKFNPYAGLGAGAIVLLALVLLSELSAPFKALITGVFIHHWIAKAVLGSLTFVLAGFLVSDSGEIFGRKSEEFAWYASLVSLALILVFFTYEFFKG